jgi:hypothetical protein
MKSDDYDQVILKAINGKLQSDFSQWDLSNRAGWSVAHWNAMFGPMPDDFDAWGMQDGSGITVAHRAAENGNLPERFTLWGLKDGIGDTVFKRMLTHIHDYSDEDKNRVTKSLAACWEDLTENDRKSIKKEAPDWFTLLSIESSLRSTSTSNDSASLML